MSEVHDLFLSQQGLQGWPRWAVGDDSSDMHYFLLDREFSPLEIGPGWPTDAIPACAFAVGQTQRVVYDHARNERLSPSAMLPRCYRCIDVILGVTVALWSSERGDRR